MAAHQDQQGSQGTSSSSEACVLLRNPIDKLTCRATVGNQRWRALVDTGANITIIRHDVLNKLSNQQKQQLQPSDVRIVNASGDRMALEGKMRIPIKISDMKLIADCHVVTQLEHPIILGMDFLRTHKATIDLEQSPQIPTEIGLTNPSILWSASIWIILASLGQ